MENGKHVSKSWYTKHKEQLQPYERGRFQKKLGTHVSIFWADCNNTDEGPRFNSFFAQHHKVNL